MEAILMSFAKLVLFILCMNSCMGQRTAKTSCPYSDNSCDGVSPLLLEHNFKIDSLGTAVRDLLSWKEVIQTKHSKEITSLEKEITALKNESLTLQNESSTQKKEILTLKNESMSQKKEITALNKEVAVLNESKQDRYPENCDEIYKLGTRRSGVYTLVIKDAQHVVHNVPVYCDMDTSTGGWTVFQRRQDGSVPFNRNWQEYKQGFGQLQTEFWLGNTWLHMITSSSTRYTLRVDLESFNNETRYAEYTEFKINNEADKYRLNVGSYSGTAGNGGINGLSYSNQRQFSTIDQDNDVCSGINCVLSHGGGGGFWYGCCENTNLNSGYRHTPVSDSNGINWYAWLQHTALKHTEMKLKPLH